jgi:N-acetylmuramoyl-L-alanine amidase
VRTLSLGDRGKEVSDVQKRLRALGYELGREGIDGYFGPRSELALRRFQQERGLYVDGVLGANAWRELVEAGYALGDRLLYLRVPAFRGDDVLALQVKLNLFGFNAGPERGIFDDDVERAVIEFQRNAGLPVDGIVGEATLVKLEALRKAESGREGKKIPERDEGYARHDTLSGASVVVDPGHGGLDVGATAGGAGRGAALREKDLTLAAGLRLAELLRAEGARVTLTRDSDQTVPLYVRCEAAEAAAADYYLSLHFAAADSEAAAGATCFFFQRTHYYSEHGARLADHIGRAVGALGTGFNGGIGRNYAVLREPTAIAVLVEPLFLTNAAEAALAGRPDFPDRLAGAVVAGLAAYVARRSRATSASATRDETRARGSAAGADPAARDTTTR